MSLDELTLGELMEEVARRMQVTNGLEFVQPVLARAVMDGIEAGFKSGEVGSCVGQG